MPLTHPERVAHAVPDRLKILALLHDAAEDGHVGLGDAHDTLCLTDWQALVLLTRRETETYAQYIQRMVKASTHSDTRTAARRAMTVKVADLRDNLWGREQPPGKSLQDRYEKALVILTAALDADAISQTRRKRAVR